MKKWIEKHLWAISVAWCSAWLLVVAGVALWYQHRTSQALGEGTRTCRCICEAQ